MPFPLSCRCKYALSALVELATLYPSGEPLQSREIARRQNIPDDYLGLVLTTLKRGGLVRSLRGMRGGWLLASEPHTVSVLDVVQCVDGAPPAQFNLSQQETAGDTTECLVVCQIWLEAQTAMQSALRQYSLQDIMEKRDSCQNNMYYI